MTRLLCMYEGYPPGLVLRRAQEIWPKLEIRPSALLRNVQNITNCMGEKTIVSVAYECERIEIKFSLPHLSCVFSSFLCGSCFDLWPLSGLIGTLLSP